MVIEFYSFLLYFYPPTIPRYYGLVHIIISIIRFLFTLHTESYLSQASHFRSLFLALQDQGIMSSYKYNLQDK